MSLLSKTRFRMLLGGLSTLLLASSCAGDDLDLGAGSGTGTVDNRDPQTWNPDGKGEDCNVDALLPSNVYGNKVKSLLTGLALTAAEADTLEADPAELKNLIDGWLSTSESEEVLTRFFMQAFQQTSTTQDTLFYMLGRNASSQGFFSNPRSANTVEMLNQNFNESFGRTVTDMVKNGASFKEVVTTDTFIMTTAQLAFMAYVDDDVVDDEEKHTYRTSAGHFPTMRFITDPNAAPTKAQTLDPNSPNFMRFYHRGLAELTTPSCNVPAVAVVDTTQNTAGDWRVNNGPYYHLWSQLMGRTQTISRFQAGCSTGARNGEPLFERTDFTDWHKVTIRKAAAAETATLFYDLPNLRSATEITLHTDRIGFLSTPGFFSTWMNNEDNSARVSINQMLIVALGQSFDGAAATTSTPPEPGAHAELDECYSCHQDLDPMRNFVRNSYSNFYGEQLDEDRLALESTFDFRGVTQTGTGIVDLANILANHPDFPVAWVQKLCFYANAEACQEGEELDRIVAAFVDSGFDFKVAIRETFASPLVTGAECLTGIDAGVDPSIARRSTFCSQLSNRTGLTDVCGLWQLPQGATNLQNDVREAVSSVPDDGFSRAEIDPVIISETGLFARANREAACVLASQRGYDEAYDALSTEDATLAMVTSVMALPANDQRHTEALTILRDHVAEAIAEGEDENTALKSAFVLACMSPSSAGVGF